MFAIGWLQQLVGCLAVGESLGSAIEHELLLSHSVGRVGQADQACALMCLLDVGVRLLSRAQALDEVRLVPFVRKISSVLVDHLSALHHHLPAAAVTAKRHHRLGAMDLHSGRGCQPVGPLVSVVVSHGRRLPDTHAALESKERGAGETTRSSPYRGVLRPVNGKQCRATRSPYKPAAPPVPFTRAAAAGGHAIVSSRLEFRSQARSI